MSDDDAVHRAWSNGHWLELDLRTNRYGLAEAEHLELAQQRRLRRHNLLLEDVRTAPRNLIPAPSMVGRFVRAQFIAHRSRHLKIADQVRVLQSRSQPRPTTTLDVAETAAAYQYLRTFRPDRVACLADSVAAYLFASAYLQDIEFVVAVRYPPFHAHAWVESQGYILNDTKKNAEGFSDMLRFGR
ncbi:lasso peptide biosynthesis B2 protein [Nocardia sp. NPDC046473]|uniref:lasso peptide biosynthesis B2 protein n=1 Tax=Nocardia sp. NPDC046473 TaxID=3155733 RepID=UPI0033DDB868